MPEIYRLECVGCEFWGLTGVDAVPPVDAAKSASLNGRQKCGPAGFEWATRPRGGVAHLGAGRCLSEQPA